MRKVLILGTTVLAVLAILATVGYACGEKSTSAKQASVEGKVCSAEKASMAAEQTDSKWETKTIAVKGMTCEASEESVSASLAKTPGVVEVVKVCHMSKHAIVKVDPAVAQDNLLTKAITDKGYEAEMIPAVAKTVGGSTCSPLCPLSGIGSKDACAAAAAATAKEAGDEKKVEDTK